MQTDIHKCIIPNLTDRLHDGLSTVKPLKSLSNQTNDPPISVLFSNLKYSHIILHGMSLHD